MGVRVTQKSRLLFGDLIIVDGVEFYDLLELPTVSEQADDTTYEWKGGDRIDLLARRFYGDPVLWWVIALANDIELVPVDVAEGTLLRIPSSRYVTQVLIPQASRSSRRIR